MTVLRAPLLASLAVAMICGSPAAAESVAVLRGPEISWVVLQSSINGPPTSRAFTAYQVSADASKAVVVRVSTWFADCVNKTLAFAQASTVDENLGPHDMILPPGGVGHTQVISSARNAVLIQLGGAVCGVGPTDWTDAPDLKALIKLEAERIQRGG